MIIVEGTISHRVFKDRIDPARHGAFDGWSFWGWPSGAAIALFVYYFFKALIFVHEHHWTLLGDGWGAWYLVEVIGFVLITPCVLFAYAVPATGGSVWSASAAVMTLVGVILNRLNTSIIAFNWNSEITLLPVLGRRSW